MKNKKTPILCVENNKDNLELMKYLFESESFDVTACDTLEDGLSQVKKKRFAAIVLDYKMGSRKTLEVCAEIRSRTEKTPIIFYSGETREMEIKRAMEHCADAFLIKPLDFIKLPETVNELIQESQWA